MQSFLNEIRARLVVCSAFTEIVISIYLLHRIAPNKTILSLLTYTRLQWMYFKHGMIERIKRPCVSNQLFRFLPSQPIFSRSNFYFQIAWTFFVKSPGCYCCPTGPFTVLEPQDQAIDEIYALQERCTTDFELAKIVKDSVGCCCFSEMSSSSNS